MKKFTCLGLSMVLAFGLLAGCGSSNSGSSDSGTQSNAPAQQETTELSGTITANGSTSMEKVIQILEEQFMIDNPGVKASYDPTGSGTGIEAAKNGTADIGLASRALKDEETARRPEGHQRGAGRHRGHRQRRLQGGGPDCGADRPGVHRRDRRLV